jgi:hypothetical protein
MKIVCFLLAILCFFILIGGGVLLGCADILQPFDTVPLGIILIVFGGIGTIAFISGVSVFYTVERERY